MQAISLITNTPARYAPVFARLALGIVIFPHGAQKLLGWFGGPGLEPTLAFFSQSLGLPPALGVLVVGAEFLGGLALILGAFSRVAAIGIAAIMLGAVLTVHAPNGFFMNWYGAQQGEGFEYHLLALGLAAATLIAGSGAFSIDRVIARRFLSSTSST